MKSNSYVSRAFKTEERAGAKGLRWVINQQV